MNSPYTRQNIKNKHDACIRTSFGQCFKTNQRASVHVWRKIEHVRPPQTPKCLSYELLLHTLNSIDVCVIERHKETIKGLKSIRVPKLTRQPLHNPLSTVTSIYPEKDILLSIITPKSLVESTRSPTQHVQKFNRMTQS
jgi:hypothetical protein